MDSGDLTQGPDLRSMEALLWEWRGRSQLDHKKLYVRKLEQYVANFRDEDRNIDLEDEGETAKQKHHRESKVHHRRGKQTI